MRALELCQFSAISLPWLFGSAKSAEALVGSSAEDSALRAMWLNYLQQKRVEWWRSSRPRPPRPLRRVAEVARDLERKVRRFERRKPWLDEGMSERTWYRRKKDGQ